MTATDHSTPDTSISLLETLADPMTDFAARLEANRNFTQKLNEVPPIVRMYLRDQILDRLEVAMTDLKVGVRPVDDVEGLVMAREAFNNY